jgi:hypothetical protein
VDKIGLSKVKKYFGRKELKLNQKIVTFIFFLALSFIFWLLTALNQSFSTNINYPIKYIHHFPEKAMVTTEPSDVTLNVTGHGYTLIKSMLTVRKHPIILGVVTINITKLPSKPDKWYTLTKPLKDRIQRQIGNEITINDIVPDTLYYTFSDIVRKKVPILPIANIEYKKQFMLGKEIIAIPDCVLISGPQSVLDTIWFLQTYDVNITNLDKHITVEAKLKPIDNVIFILKKVNLFIPVEKFTEATIEVPIRPINLPDSLSLKTFPSVVKVSCIVPLKNYSKLKPQQFKAVVDYSLTKTSINNKIKVLLTVQPDFVSQVNYTPKSVDFIIEK